MPTEHTTNLGECLSSLAEEHGFRDFRHIYDDPANAALRKIRPNPNQLHPGDVVTIPDKQGKSAEAATGKVHTVRLSKNEALLRVVVEDESGRPLGNLPFVLELGSQPGKSIRGTSKPSGLLEATIPPDEMNVTLKLTLPGDTDGPSDNASWACTLGDLRPMRDLPGDNLGVHGAKARLLNLGFYQGAVDEQLDASFRDALAAFRATHGLRGPAVLDATTIALLERDHDKVR